MSWNEQADSRSCVLLRLGERRFALAADQVAELVAPSRIFRFPHRTPEIDGVILRRGRTVPVCDLADKLTGKRLTSRRFYLIANADLTPAGPNDSPHVAAWLSHDGEVIEVLNLAALTPGIPPASETAHLQTLPEARA
jgi:hypothetical protein